MNFLVRCCVMMMMRDEQHETPEFVPNCLCTMITRWEKMNIHNITRKTLFHASITTTEQRTVQSRLINVNIGEKLPWKINMITYITLTRWQYDIQSKLKVVKILSFSFLVYIVAVDICLMCCAVRLSVARVSRVTKDWWIDCRARLWHILFTYVIWYGTQSREEKRVKWNMAY